jgi:hypothetical protein
VLHIGAEWTSLRDRTFLGRICLTAFALALAAVGNGIAPLAFVVLVAAAVLAQLFLEAVAVREGATTAWEPPATAHARCDSTSQPQRRLDPTTPARDPEEPEE